MPIKSDRNTTVHMIAAGRYPERVHVVNRPEFNSTVFHRWAARRNITVEHIRPEKPSDNAFAESFVGKLRDESLNEEWFFNLRESQHTIKGWGETYNAERPHSSLNKLTPYKVIKEQNMPLPDQRLNSKLVQMMRKGQTETRALGFSLIAEYRFGHKDVLLFGSKC